MVIAGDALVGPQTNCKSDYPQTPKPASSTGAAYSVTVSDSGDVSTSSAGTPTQTLPRAASQQITLTWQAEDPDGDRLIYSVYFRGEEESQWKLLKGNTHDNSLTFDADVLADGKYFFRVMASDREANPPASAHEATLVSAPVMIDNTPPLLTIGEVRHSGDTAHIAFEAADAASALRRCEYSLDAAGWVPVEAADASSIRCARSSCSTSAAWRPASISWSSAPPIAPTIPA